MTTLIGYKSLSRNFLENVKVIESGDTPDKISSVSPYWRVAY